MDPGSPSATALDELSPAEVESSRARLSTWVPYAIIASLMLVTIVQAVRIVALKSELQSIRTELVRADQSSAMMSLRVSTFEARDPAFQSAKIAVAWDPFQHHGVITTQNLPAPAAGYHYQLWVLDPGAQAPLDAGPLHPEKPSASFTVKSLSMLNPGFAISLEPVGDNPHPTGAILFAVEPGQ